MLLYDGELTKVSVLQAQFYDVILFLFFAVKEKNWEKKKFREISGLQTKGEKKGSEEFTYLYFCDS